MKKVLSSNFKVKLVQFYLKNYCYAVLKSDLESAQPIGMCAMTADKL